MIQLKGGLMEAGIEGERPKLIDVTLDRRNIPQRYREASSRLIIVDYDGVLVPESGRPGFTIPNRETRAVIQLLSSDPSNTFMLMSGRDRSHLDLHWRSFDLVMVAEYGAQFKERGSTWRSLFELDDSWMDRVDATMQTLPLLYDGSFVERKSHSIAWHFMTPTSAAMKNEIPQVMEALQTLPRNKDFEVFRANDRVELAPRGVDPGSFLARWLGGKKFDFVIALGGARVEESLFRILTPEAVTVSVRPSMTSTAVYWLRSQADVVPFLRSLPGTV
jgi:trehalose 6-phosphate synthase/phosphatase